MNLCLTIFTKQCTVMHRDRVKCIFTAEHLKLKKKKTTFFQPCFVWGSRHRWDALSTSWSLGGTSRTALWTSCDPTNDCIPEPQCKFAGFSIISPNNDMVSYYSMRPEMLNCCSWVYRQHLQVLTVHIMSAKIAQQC